MKFYIYAFCSALFFVSKAMEVTTQALRAYSDYTKADIARLLIPVKSGLMFPPEGISELPDLKKMALEDPDYAFLLLRCPDFKPADHGELLQAMNNRLAQMTCAATRRNLALYKDLLLGHNPESAKNYSIAAGENDAWAQFALSKGERNDSLFKKLWLMKAARRELFSAQLAMAIDEFREVSKEQASTPSFWYERVKESWQNFERDYPEFFERTPEEDKAIEAALKGVHNLAIDIDGWTLVVQKAIGDQKYAYMLIRAGKLSMSLHNELSEALTFIAFRARYENDIDALFNLAVLMTEQVALTTKNFEEAIGCFERILARQPGHAGALFEIGLIFARNRTDHGFKSILQAAELGHVSAQCWAADHLLERFKKIGKKSDLEKAYDFLSQAYKVNPQQAELRLPEVSSLLDLQNAMVTVNPKANYTLEELESLKGKAPVLTMLFLQSMCRSIQILIKRENLNNQARILALYDWVKLIISTAIESKQSVSKKDKVAKKAAEKLLKKLLELQKWAEKWPEELRTLQFVEEKRKKAEEKKRKQEEKKKGKEVKADPVPEKKETKKEVPSTWSTPPSIDVASTSNNQPRMAPQNNLVQEPLAQEPLPEKKPKVKTRPKVVEESKKEAEVKAAAPTSERPTLVRSLSLIDVKRTHSEEAKKYKRLSRQLSYSDLKAVADIRLSEADIRMTLRQLKEDGYIEYRDENNKIIATKRAKRDEILVKLIIHTHGDWQENLDIRRDFLRFVKDVHPTLWQQLCELFLANA